MSTTLFIAMLFGCLIGIIYAPHSPSFLHSRTNIATPVHELRSSVAELRAALVDLREEVETARRETIGGIAWSGPPPEGFRQQEGSPPLRGSRYYEEGGRYYEDGTSTGGRHYDGGQPPRRPPMHYRTQSPEDYSQEGERVQYEQCMQELAQERALRRYILLNIYECITRVYHDLFQ
jgi:hypothetical protein